MALVRAALAHYAELSEVADGRCCLCSTFMLSDQFSNCTLSLLPERNAVDPKGWEAESDDLTV